MKAPPARPGGAVLLALTAAVALLGSSTSSPPERQDGQLTIDQLLSIPYPSSPVWSPSGERIAYLWELDGALDLWWTAEEREEPVAVTRESGRPQPRRVEGFCWTPDGSMLVYALGGRLYVYTLASAAITPLTDGRAADSSPALSSSGTRLAFIRDGALWVSPFPDVAGNLLADGDGDFGRPMWSGDGRHLVASYGERRRQIEDTGSLVGGKMAFSRWDSTPDDLVVIDIGDGTQHWLERGDAYSSEASFSAAGTLAWQEIAHDARKRRILIARPPDWSPREIVAEVDDAWWTLTYLAAGPRWHPRAERFVFVSDRDGWAHLYLADLDDRAAAEPVQLTRGEYEVEAPAWSPDGGTLVVSTNRGSAAERGLFLLQMTDGGSAGDLDPEPISRLRGTSTASAWRPDGERLAFLHADIENPLDVWVQEPGPAMATQLTDSWPEDADESGLLTPRLVRFPGADGRLIPAHLLLPPDHDDREEDFPAIVWVHGGGIRQNRVGWHPLRAYSVFYGFHQYLAQRGYVVLAVDYRGSIGYGRDFRAGQHMDLGGKDLDDILAAERYLHELSQVRIGRTGVWGISYGGYLTLQAMTQAPGAFDAGINVAGVADWRDWAVDPGGPWIDGRMGPPEESPALFEERSPIHFVDRLAAPLLSLHGTADSSVPVLQTFRLVDALVAAGKPFDVMFYPGEEHVFVRSRTWRDAFRRIEGFFDDALRDKPESGR